MDVFQLDDWLIREYEAFSRSFVRIRSEEIGQKVDAGYAERRFWPAPLLQINPHYKDSGRLKALVGDPGLHRSTAQIFRDSRADPSDPDQSLTLYRHQAEAVQIAISGKSFVVTTGTGSGKSLCFFIPIVDAILKAKESDTAPRTRAIVIYPMNALANSQMEELRRFLGRDGLIHYARYTGQESNEEREAIRRNAPDILLTNFMMLEMLMTRQSELDRDVIANCRGLEFVVLDELHTYRGRQGADVAMLMRRLKARLCDAAHLPVCIGTSATMSSDPNETERRRAVAEVASTIFGTDIGVDAVITETLKRATVETKSASQGLPGLEAAVLRALEPGTFEGRRNADLATDDLAIWVETRIGLKNVEVKPERGDPISIERATAHLAADTGLDTATCENALKYALLAFSKTEDQRGVVNGENQPLFAFRLHQVIAGAGRLYATLDRPGERSITFDGQKFDPENPEKLLFATHFCRRCGQEHHPAFLVEDLGEKRFEKREIDDTPVEEDDNPNLVTRRWGFLMPEPKDGNFDFRGAPEDYPETWLETTKRGEVRLKANYRKTQAEAVDVRADGTMGVGGIRAWFMPGRFKFCPACGDHHSDATRDINRLASLSAEGRSSATTILIAALLRWMQGAGSEELPEAQRKLLSFTDNRQDAALQAGHFNDFIFVTLLRAGILAALGAAGEEGLTHDRVGQEVQAALGFIGSNTARRSDWMVDPAIKGAGVMDAEKAIREGLSHRFWIDQRRGWRFTNPNLEQLGLVHAEYLYLDEMCNDLEVFANVPLLERASVDERSQAATALLDYMRKGLAVETDALDQTTIEALARRMRTTVKEPWAIAEERLQAATTLVTNPPRRADIKPRDEGLLLRCSARSAIGRQVRQLRFDGNLPPPNEVESIIQGLLDACKMYGMLASVPAAVGGQGWRINANVVVFKTGPGPGEVERHNDFFATLYQNIADILKAGGEALFGFEGREHTAQVDPFVREAREARFRYGVDDRAFLKDNEAKMKEQAEDDRRLPTLFCSPTMELGVDISAMNVVYLRNMPPTPANYVQRSGRAGRSGQAALILGYCAAQSPHDQYFFRNPAAMVSGVVKSPTIDLANQDLVDSHLQAEWLAATGVDLVPNIPGNLEMTAEDKPLSVAVRDTIDAPKVRDRGIKAMTPVLEVLERDFAGVSPPWLSDTEGYAAELTDDAAGRFDSAFDRWRALIASAERQRDDASRALADYSITGPERRAATARQAQANGQIALLLGGTSSFGSDFYVYRYLATEGFLPGYNFPRLPLMAFIPGSANKGQDRYLQRARFLAISEFGPGSLIYHEGRAYRVDRAMLRETSGGPDGQLPTFATALCPSCGAGHDGEAPENCHVCGRALSDASLTRDLYRIDNVATRPVERITANDEERRRQGFDIQTTFQMPAGRGRLEVELIDADGAPLATVTFSTAASIRRINRGLRRRADEMQVGFLIDPTTGRWRGKNAGDVGDSEPTIQTQRIAPVVEDRKNTLLIRFPARLRLDAGADYERLMVTLQHALTRGIESAFQLEEGEILGEPTPSRGTRNAILFYEAAEGGAGALGRLVRDVETFRTVARDALRAMHATEGSIDAAITGGEEALTDVEDAKCVAGCYHCLLSYYNQPDQADIDRRLVTLRTFLVRLLSADIATTGAEEAGGNPVSPPPDDLPAPDAKPLRLEGIEIPMVWRAQRIAAIDDGEATPDLLSALEDKGLQVFSLPPAEPERGAMLDQLRRALGGEA